jgi:L-fuculose-phosphate aldolase
VATVTQTLREQVAWACRILASEGYADLTLGHVSAREPGGTTVWIKRKGIALDEVGPGDVIEFDLAEGPPASPEMHLEAVLHSEAYRARPDVGAVVHGHPPYATAFSGTSAALEMLTHDAVLFANGLAYFDEGPELVVAADQGRAVAAALGDRRAVVLRNHGVLVVGQDVPWAVLCAATLERAIRLQSIAETLGELRPIPVDRALRMHDGKYQDRFVEEYWAAWVRRLGGGSADDGRGAA